MPQFPGSRVRGNNAYGVTTDNPLGAGATTLNSTQLQLLPAIITVTQHAVIVLDPKRVFGEPEIVIVTAHTGLATSATITRAAYGTAARSHNVGTAWAHVSVAEDYTHIVTSSTRPNDFYLGQRIFETDTLSHRYYNGTGWDSSPPVGSIVAFGGSVVPPGWLLANGVDQSRTGVTAALFAVFQLNYGSGNGTTTFGIPNLKGKIPVGLDSGQAEFDSFTDNVGTNTVTLTGTDDLGNAIIVPGGFQIPRHVHPLGNFTHAHGISLHNHNVPDNLPYITGGNGNHRHANTTNDNGSHDHQSTRGGQPVMVIQTGAGPFNVAAPGGSDFVTFDTGHTARTSFDGSHGHPINDTYVYTMQPAFAYLPSDPNVNNAAWPSGSVSSSVNSPSSTTVVNNLQPYVVVNYIIKI